MPTPEPMTLEERAYALLKSDPDYLRDAIEGSAVNNTVVGGLLSISTWRPRWATEDAVRAALRRIEEEVK